MKTPTTSAERMRVLREKRENDQDFDIDKHRDREKKRIRNYRKRQKKQLTENQKKELRQKESERKKKYRKKKQEESSARREREGGVGRGSQNKKTGLKVRKANTYMNLIEKKKSEDKIKVFGNTIRRLKYHNSKLVSAIQQRSPEQETPVTTTLMDIVSPAAKKRALPRC